MKIYKTACVFGGTGFIGRQVVRELAAAGYNVKVATRVPERAFFLKPCGNVGQVVPFRCSYISEVDINEAVKGSDVVVNCIGILYQRRRNDFVKSHVDIPGAIAKACKKHGVERFVHISAMGAGIASSKYAITKGEGEKAVMKAFKEATILRPSVVFGEDDSFFNKFAGLAGLFPILPLIGGGHTKFQPVYVGDVADAVIKAIAMPAGCENSPQGKIYELGGPEVLDFKEIYARLFRYTKQSPCLISLPFPLAKVKGFFLGLLPAPMLTMDQVESLKTDNVVSEEALGLSDLGLQATALDSILPQYLCRYVAGGRFADVKKVS